MSSLVPPRTILRKTFCALSSEKLLNTDSLLPPRPTTDVNLQHSVYEDTLPTTHALFPAPSIPSRSAEFDIMHSSGHLNSKSQTDNDSESDVADEDDNLSLNNFLSWSKCTSEDGGLLRIQ